MDAVAELKVNESRQIHKIFLYVINKDTRQDCTLLTFEVFCSIVDHDLLGHNFSGDYKLLNVLVEYINVLRVTNQFNSEEFLELLLQKFDNLPLEILWWLNEHSVVSCLLYWELTKPIDLADDLKRLILDSTYQKSCNKTMIIKSLLSELMKGSFRPYAGIYGILRSKIFATYCTQVIDNLMQDMLNSILTNNQDLHENYYISFFEEMLETVSVKMVNLSCKAILSKLFTCKNDRVDMFEAYVYQQLWASDKLEEKLRYVYHKIFTNFCTMKDILQLLEEHKQHANWKFVLSAVGVCASRSVTGLKDIQEAAQTLFKDSLQGGHTRRFVEGLLFIRQMCLEPTVQLTYEAWYTQKFVGDQSKFQNTNTSFKFFISTLTMLLPYEPEYFLKIHIGHRLPAPRGCNYLIHDYKNLCRSRINELERSPSITMNDVQIKILHLIETSVQNEKLTHPLVYIIQHRYADYLNFIVPQVLRDGMPFTKIHHFLKERSYINDDIISTISPASENVLIDNYSENFQ